MVNRLWCETVVPILWRNPWNYNEINYCNKSYLFVIIACYLFDEIKEFITNQSIQLPLAFHQSFLFDYLSFCRSIKVFTINNIISIGSSLANNQFYMQQNFYYFFMKKCSELKYFDMRLIKHQIFDFPEAKARFESLCELECDTSTFYSYFYKLSRFCQHMQRLIIDNTVTKPNDRIVKLIEVQEEFKADSIEHLGLIFKRKEIQLNGSNFYDLEILKIEWNKLNVISSIVENNGGRLKNILFNSNIVIGYENNSSSFNENSLKFIRNIYENCPSIEYLSIIISPSKEHFNEFEKLLKVCKNLKSLSRRFLYN
uniref:F-box domain-containing protein n=1 Tax=Rhizophagus irregularis (strain DAOM 181602 / DAOM 197198 / MUCL 43194) TaxID=747089 RepID=U9U7V5_RHIID